MLDASNGTALNGNGGTVTFTPGTDGFDRNLPASNPLVATNGFTAAGLTLNLGLTSTPLWERRSLSSRTRAVPSLATSPTSRTAASSH